MSLGSAAGLAVGVNRTNSRVRESVQSAGISRRLYSCTAVRDVLEEPEAVRHQLFFL